MALRDIRIWPDPILAQRAAPVATVDDSVRQLVADLFDTRYRAQGIGLAANQVGDARAVLVIDLDADGAAAADDALAQELTSWGYRGPLALINPKITHSAGTLLWDEGCLSVPGVTDTVSRWARVTVSYFDPQGAPRSLTATDLFAVCLQHEMDHLMGRVFVAYLSPARRLAARRKMLRLKRAGERQGAARAADCRRRVG